MKILEGFYELTPQEMSAILIYIAVGVLLGWRIVSIVLKTDVTNKKKDTNE